MEPHATARVARMARQPSASMAPYPMGRASVAHATCLEVVPLLTRPWKPETAPQAMVIINTGISAGSAESSPTAGAAKSGAATKKPT